MYMRKLITSASFGTLVNNWHLSCYSVYTLSFWSLRDKARMFILHLHLMQNVCGDGDWLMGYIASTTRGS